MPREGKAEIAEKWKQYTVPLVDALCTGIHKRFDEVMEDEMPKIFLRQSPKQENMS